MTDCIGKVLGKEVVYRLLSSIAHSHPCALIQAGFHAPDPNNPTTREKHLRPDMIAWLMLEAADVLSMPAWERSLLFGFDKAGLEAVLDRRYGEMGCSPDSCFWRQSANRQ